MKFITNAFSSKMFVEPHLIFRRWQMTENEFRNEMQGAESRVSAEDIAHYLNVELNYTPIQARVGDVILHANCRGGYLNYYYYLVCENKEDKPFKEDDVGREELLY